MSTQRFPAAYDAALAMFVRKGSERALHAAYELGREAVALELSIVELARLHHAALERRAAMIVRARTYSGSFYLRM